MWSYYPKIHCTTNRTNFKEETRLSFVLSGDIKTGWCAVLQMEKRCDKVNWISKGRKNGMEKEKIIRQMARRLLAGAQPFPFGICRFEQVQPCLPCRAMQRIPQGAQSVLVCLFPYYMQIYFRCQGGFFEKFLQSFTEGTYFSVIVQIQKRRMNKWRDREWAH